MLGLLALGLTSIMIYTLVKNALLGKQLAKDDHFNGTVELIIPVAPNSEFFPEAWGEIHTQQLKVHILIDGHHPSLNAWMELKTKMPYLEIHSFPMRPTHVEAIPWMLDQIAPKIQGEVVIIGDSELVPTEHAFLSIAKNVTDKERSYFVVPQTAKFNVLGEAISVLNPTLAFASFFGFRKWQRNLTHPLLSISQGWMAMTLKTFKELDFKTVRISRGFAGSYFPIKSKMGRPLEEAGQSWLLAFYCGAVLVVVSSHLPFHSSILVTGQFVSAYTLSFFLKNCISGILEIDRSAPCGLYFLDRNSCVVCV
jgi:hypothetical protein